MNPAPGEHAADAFGVGERERARVGGRSRQVAARAERPGDLADPLVAGQRLPGHEHESPTWTQARVPMLREPGTWSPKNIAAGG